MASFTDTLKKSSTSSYSANLAVTKATPDTTELSTDNLVRSDKYDWYTQYQDSIFSSISATKDINVDESQINITQEENSQYIPFKMPRFWDGIDLMDMLIKIRFVNENGEEGLSTPKNVQYNDTTIVFHWLMDANATFLSGVLKFEIFATGVNEKGENYVWRTKPNGKLNILEALTSTSSAITPDSDWTMQFIREMDEKIGEAQILANQAAEFASQAQDTAEQLAAKIALFETDIENTVSEAVASELENYYTKTEVDKLFDDFDISDQLKDVQDQIDNMDGLADFNVVYDSEGQILTFYNGEATMNEIELDMTPKASWVSSYNTAVESKIETAVVELSEEFDEKLRNVDVTSALTELEDKVAENYYNKEETDAKYAEKTAVTSLTNEISKLSSAVESNTTNMKSVSEKMFEIEETLNSVNTDPSKRYYSTYDASTGEYKLIEAVDDGEGGETETVVSQHIIQGGGGGASSSSTITIDRITESPVVALKDDESINIKYNFTSVDSSGDDTGEGTAVWKVGNSVVATTLALQGENTFDIKPYVATGTYKATLTITDAAGSVSMKNWTVQVIDVRLESTFNDTYVYPVGGVSFAYTPYGSIAKNVHFLLDGQEIGTVNTSVSGVPMNYTIPAQEHGSHLLEAYITAEINNSTVETAHIYKDIMWCDPSSNVPIIGTIYQSFTAKQYDTTNIIYNVYDPKTETPMVTLAVDGKTVSTLTLDSTTSTWAYKSSDVGSHILTITCGETVKTITVEIEKLDIDVTPVTADLAFDFNPTGYSNSDTENRLWKDGSVTMTVSDNFDWVNGGYQIDENGDQYFCVKSGTTATINYNLFSDDPKRNGKEFKVVFRTDNIRSRDTSFITCMNSDIGLDMKVESANIYSSNDSLYSPYCENDIIEFEFNINKDTDIPMVLTYEDGVPFRPMMYTSDSSFKQVTAQPITIGSKDCDVHIYRMKAYTASLSNNNVKNNFIADARNAEEMVARHKRNQIYDENSALTPETLAEKCPDLRVIIVDAPWFTNDKSDKVSDTTIRMIYKNGDPVLDNWTCTGAKHSGQGTSSNEYGYSGRNLDLIMNGSDALFTFGDGVTTSKTISLTRNSVPIDYLNVKVKYLPLYMATYIE